MGLLPYTRDKDNNKGVGSRGGLQLLQRDGRYPAVVNKPERETEILVIEMFWKEWTGFFYYVRNELSASSKASMSVSSKETDARMGGNNNNMGGGRNSNVS